MACRKQRLKILSVKIEANFLSAAVFEDYDLLYWRSKRINEGKMPPSRKRNTLRNILEELIEFWNPDIIVAEEVYFSQSKKSKILATFVEEIKKISREKKLKLLFYSPVSVREYICKEEKTTKMNTARIIVEEYYSWLMKKYENEEKKKWYQAKKGLRIFDAVALGLYCLDKLKNK